MFLILGAGVKQDNVQNAYVLELDPVFLYWASVDFVPLSAALLWHITPSILPVL
jgi:hypothetical protein